MISNDSDMKKIISILLTLTMILQSSCLTLQTTPKKPLASDPGRLAVVSTETAPEIKFDGFPHGKVEGAGHVAGEVFFNCFAHGPGSCSGEFCGAALLLYLAGCGAASIIGGVYGAIVTPSGSNLAASESTLTQATYVSSIQAPLRNYVAAAALENFAQLLDVSSIPKNTSTPQDYRYLSSRGVDTVLEVGLGKVYTEKAYNADLLMLSMTANARVIRTKDNSVLFTDSYEYTASKALALAEWSKNNGAELTHALQVGYEKLATNIYRSIFIVYPFPDSAWHGFPVAVVGLAPIYPTLSIPSFSDSWVDKSTTINNLQPRLQWQAFPRPSDIANAPNDMNRIRNVSYDLRVKKMVKHESIDVIYEVDRLPNNEYQIKEPLDAGSWYFWTVRARFELDGREWVTPWSSIWKQGDYQFRTL